MPKYEVSIYYPGTNPPGNPYHVVLRTLNLDKAFEEIRVLLKKIPKNAEEEIVIRKI